MSCSSGRRSGRNSIFLIRFRTAAKPLRQNIYSRQPNHFAAFGVSRGWLAAVLRPNRNVWRIEHASARRRADRRRGILSGGARRPSCKARHSIFVARLGHRQPDPARGRDRTASDGLPASLAGIPHRTGAPPARAEDQSAAVGLFGRSMPASASCFRGCRCNGGRRSRSRLCLDNIVPFGCSQHQKIIVVDDALAFSGGLDLTIRRWDTSEHAIDEERSGGARRRALSAVSRRADDGGRRRRRARLPKSPRALAARHAAGAGASRTCERRRSLGRKASRPISSTSNVGIARTQPALRRSSPRCAKSRHCSSIRSMPPSARSTSRTSSSPRPRSRERLARRLRERETLEVVIVAPHEHESWVESRTMRNGRIRFWRTLRRAAPRPRAADVSACRERRQAGRTP